MDLKDNKEGKVVEFRERKRREKCNYINLKIFYTNSEGTNKNFKMVKNISL